MSKLSFNWDDIHASRLAYVIGYTYKFGLKFIRYDNIDNVVNHWLIKQVCDVLKIELIKITHSMYDYRVIEKQRTAFDAAQYASTYEKYMKAVNDGLPFVFIAQGKNVINSDVIERLLNDGLKIVEGPGGIGIQLKEKVIYEKASML